MTSTTGTGTGRSASSGAFGTPLYGTINSPTTTATTSSGSTASMSFNTVGQRRAPSYTTTIAYGTPFGFAPPTVAPAGALQTKLTTVFQGTSMLPPNTNFQIAIDGGGTVVLRGQVASESERRLAEGMVRLEPGVRNVRNLITIAAPRAGTVP
jgi:hypothetical protein